MKEVPQFRRDDDLIEHLRALSECVKELQRLAIQGVSFPLSLDGGILSGLPPGALKFAKIKTLENTVGLPLNCFGAWPCNDLFGNGVDLSTVIYLEAYSPVQDAMIQGACCTLAVGDIVVYLAFPNPINANFNGGNWTITGIIVSTLAVGPHSLLNDGPHPDTTDSPPSAGAMIVGNAETPSQWTILSAGANTYILKIVGGMPTWSANTPTPHALLDGNVDNDTANHAPVNGDIIIAAGGVWTALGIDTANRVLYSTGTAPAWSPAGANGSFLTVASGALGWFSGGAAGSLLYNNAANSPQWLAIGNATAMLYVSGGGVPAWTAQGAAGGIMIIDAAGQVGWLGGGAAANESILITFAGEPTWMPPSTTSGTPLVTVGGNLLWQTGPSGSLRVVTNVNTGGLVAQAQYAEVEIVQGIITSVTTDNAWHNIPLSGNGWIPD